MTDRREWMHRAIAGTMVSLPILLALGCDVTRAEPFIAPGRSEIRSDLQTLADENVLDAPVTSWPLSWQSLADDLDGATALDLSPAARTALARIESLRAADDQKHRVMPHFRLGGATEPVVIRSFSSTPRDQGEVEAGFSYAGDHLSLNLSLTRAFDSPDEWRPDGSYVALTTRNWSFVAGYPERWWGPGMQGSLILSTNAKPLPQIGVQRLSAEGFDSAWLRWIGPWSVSTFIGQFDDARFVEDALLFGLRLSSRPLPQLEIAFSRTAQLCGQDRPCGSDELFNMFIGKDNRGRNIAADEEPGNQLAGFDVRWAFADRPLAIYWQWIGEDSRQGGPQIGSWLRMVGFELTGSRSTSGWRHRTFIELADTTCQQGGAGFGGNKFNCSYQHSVFKTGYRYDGKPLGYTTDTDSESAAVITVLTGPRNRTYELGAYSARINQGPVAALPHSIAPAPASLIGVDVAHIRELPIGRLRARLSVSEQRDQLTGITDTETALALEWLVGYR